MCVGNIRKEAAKKGGDGSHGNNGYFHSPNMFHNIERQLIIHRTMLMQRLVQDPFYRVMNISSSSRLWMLRHLAHLADHTLNRYRINLLQFFERMGRDDVLKFLRYKNAPNEMIELWSRMHPVMKRDASTQRSSPVNKPRT